MPCRLGNVRRGIITKESKYGVTGSPNYVRLKQKPDHRYKTCVFCAHCFWFVSTCRLLAVHPTFQSSPPASLPRGPHDQNRFRRVFSQFSVLLEIECGWQLFWNFCVWRPDGQLHKDLVLPWNAIKDSHVVSLVYLLVYLLILFCRSGDKDTEFWYPSGDSGLMKTSQSVSSLAFRSVGQLASFTAPVKLAVKQSS